MRSMFLQLLYCNSLKMCLLVIPIKRNRVSASFDKLTSTSRTEQLCDALLWLSWQYLQQHAPHIHRIASYRHRRHKTMHAHVSVSRCAVCVLAMSLYHTVCVLLVDFFQYPSRWCVLFASNAFQFGIISSPKYFIGISFHRVFFIKCAIEFDFIAAVVVVVVVFIILGFLVVLSIGFFL